ncbi:MAG: tRNA uracil 4-sulfurtransferase ThiI [Methanoregula sp.]|jgi:thiamine biosynthesis protein ThiI
MQQEATGKKIVMARYGELFLKSEPVKHHFIGLLKRNIGKALTASGLAHHFETPRGRILISCTEPDAVADIASRTFGVIDVSVCTLTTTEADDLCSAAIALAEPKLHADCTFAVRAKRQHKTGLDSQELGALIGSAIYDRIPGLTVDLNNPGYEIFVEVRDFGGLVYDSRIPAPGGLPWGTQGRLLSLISSGIDSPVASWLAMKRGCEITHLHLDGGRWAGPDVTAAAIENHRQLSRWCAGNPLSMIIASSEPLYDRMHELKIPPRYRCVICKRFMLGLAARLMEHEGALGIATGESLGQVASQTLANLAVISEAVPAPIIRPLITYDKEETITLARMIGTFVAHPGDLACRAVPKMPATAAVLEEIKAAEEKMDITSIIDKATENLRYVTALNGGIPE